jgi:drug/metabolite transporter (DMT)-like permease
LIAGDESRQNKMKQVYGFVCLTAFLFGTMEVALKVAGGDMDSFQLTFLRFAIGGLMLLPFGLAEIRMKNIKLEMKDIGWLLLVGIMGIPISMLFFQLGVVRSNASTASVLICLNPLFTMVIAHFFAGEPMNKVKVLSFFIGVAAMIFMIRPWDLEPGNTPAGMICMLVAAVTFSIYTVMGKRSTLKLGVMAQTSISFLLGSAVLLAVILIMGRPILAGVPQHIWLVLYIGVFVTGIGYWSYFQAIKRSDASTGSIAFFIKPAIAPIMAVIILGENLMWNAIVGIVMLLAASFLNLRENRKVSELNDRIELEGDQQEIQHQETGGSRKV